MPWTFGAWAACSTVEKVTRGPARERGAVGHGAPGLVSEAVAHGLAELVVGEGATLCQPGAAVDGDDGVERKDIADALFQHLPAGGLGEDVADDRHLLLLRHFHLARGVVLEEVVQELELVPD